jgi:hypothetical protein
MKRKTVLLGLAVVALLVFAGLTAMAAVSPAELMVTLLASLPFVAVGAALTADRDTHRVEGDLVSLGVAASKKIYAGSIAAVDANGYATPGATATTLKYLGRAESQADNSSGSDGDVSVTVRRGIFKWENSSAGDAITDADIGATCYIVDDQTVAKTDGTSTRSAAGKVFKVDSDGVWVDTR